MIGVFTLKTVYFFKRSA